MTVLFPILRFNIPNIVQLAKRRLCCVTKTFETKISQVLIGIFDVFGIFDPFTTMGPKINSLRHIPHILTLKLLAWVH